MKVYVYASNKLDRILISFPHWRVVSLIVIAGRSSSSGKEEGQRNGGEGAVVKSTQYIQEARVKCFAVHLLKFEILQTTWKTKQKHHNAKSICEKSENHGSDDLINFWCDLQHFYF